jgi:hypothetical protein
LHAADAARGPHDPAGADHRFKQGEVLQGEALVRHGGKYNTQD